MKQSKLVRIIKAFDYNEINRLDAFLKSPYFHQKGRIPQDELRLFELLNHHSTHYSDNILSKETLFHQLYPDRIYTNGLLAKKMSTLLKRIESFIFYEDISTNDNSFNRLMGLSRFFRKKNLKGLYQNNLKRLRKGQNKVKKKGPNNLLHEFQIQQEVNENKELNNTLRDELNLSSILNSLDDFYLTSKLYYSCNLLFQRLFHTQTNPQDSSMILKKIDPILQKGIFTELPMVKIYSLIFSILQKRKQDQFDHNSFNELEEFLELHEDQIPLRQLKEIYAFCRSFYLRQFNKGNLALQHKIFNLYIEHLKKGYLLYEGGLHPVIYRNIVDIGLKLKKYNWVYSFIEEYKDQIIGTNYPNEVYRFNLADYYFNIKEYEKAKDNLVVIYKDKLYKITAKRLVLKIQVEEESTSIDSDIETFRHEIRRLSDSNVFNSTNHIIANKNFINMLKQILSPKTYNNPIRKKNYGRRLLA